MDTVLFVLHIMGRKPISVFYFRVEEKFAGGNFEGGKFREIPFAVDIYFAGGKFRAKSNFANTENFLNVKNTCYTVLGIFARLRCNVHVCGWVRCRDVRETLFILN